MVRYRAIGAMMNQVQWCYVFVRETIENKRGMISAVLNETNGSCLEKAMNAPLVWRAKGVSSLDFDSLDSSSHG